jgi:hypothetical protein
MSGRGHAVLQAPIVDGLAFDPFALFEDDQTIGSRLLRTNIC